jgi:peptidase A4-like protein
MRLRRLPALLIACAASALGAPAAPAAAAGTSRFTSTNWAGYAVSRAGTTVRHVSASWVQPAVDCSAGGRTYSAVWVGLGGFHTTSRALEQVGTEADCASGRARYSGWYELVPDASHSARIAVAPGDRLHASVAVAGTVVTLTLRNETRGATFSKVLRASAVDTTSAEWIVEAPSLCTTSGSCASTSLAAFEPTRFTGAQAVSASGHAGTLRDSAWHATAIDLTAGPGARRFADDRVPGPAGGSEATTGALDAGGASFAVTYTGGDAVSGSDPGQTAAGPAAAAGR